MTCPPFSDLCASDAPVALAEHLIGCPRCRAIVARVDKTDEPATQPVTAYASHSAIRPRAGDVWTFWASMTDEYTVGAVLDANDVEVLIIPILMEATWASDEDLVLPQDVLGYIALAPIWAGDHVLVEQAIEAVDVLSEKQLGVFRDAYDAFFAGEPLPEPGGPPVLNEFDPRVAAHAAMSDDLKALYSPWSLLQVADELGPVVANRRADLGVTLEDLDLDTNVWDAFEGGDSDPYVAIPASEMARVVRELGLTPSRRVLDLARASVGAHHVSENVTGAPAMARRRRGHLAKGRRDPRLARVAADRYADALAKELGL